MFSEVIQHTPTWVWVVFVMLVAFGARQLQEQRRTLRKAVTLSLVMAGLSLYGLASTFQGSPSALAAWMIGVVATLALAQMTNAWSRTRWSNAEQRLVVPGSWVPLALFMSLFVIKFGVGMNVAVHPELVHHAMFSSLIGLCYGAFSGIFLSRGLAMWRVARLAGATQPAY
jgi:drug/metabolite transporter (DMT)-like permease